MFCNNNMNDMMLRFVILLGMISFCAGDCIWYDQCGHDPQHEDHIYNCVYNGPPKPFKTQEARDLYADLCPDLSTGPNVPTCCADDQIVTLNSQIAFPRQALQRCPSCYHNFLNIWCYLTCAPNQAEFMKVNKTTPFKLPNGTTVESITAVDFVIKQSAAQGMFDSCKNVQMPSSNERALSLLCGHEADQCSPKKWLDYMGTTENGAAPFDIFFTLTEKNVTFNGTILIPEDTKPIPCNMAPSNTTEPCSCQDCKPSCAPVPPPPPPAKTCEIFHIDCYVFGFSVGFGAFLVVFGCYSICYNILVQDSLRLEEPGEESSGCCGRKGLAVNRNYRKQQYLESISKDQLGCCESMGAKMEAFLEHRFNKLGFMCANNPLKVCLVVLLITGGLCGGAALFTVTTDPVKLWSAPDSVARTQKEYFDSHFVPFYRTEQLIISRPNNHTMVPHGQNPVVNYSNIFDLSFMHEVLDLQLAVANITAELNNQTVTLQDICFAPLSPDNNNCTIQSVLNYFQNSHEMLDKEVKDQFGWFVLADYLDHLSYCVQSPYSVNDTTALHTPCLATFGGPVFPWVALGGFKDKDYKTSEAFVITFVVNNSLDDSKNAPAKAWEAKFIEFMKEYVKSHPHVHIAYSSERSIEDEIERESNSDVITILASYLIMFAYITITLGQYSYVDRIMINAKITLGLAGVIIVLLSVGVSIGFYSYLGIPSTLIIIEVVPFLVLAVGVDNIFILVQTYQRDEVKDGETVEHMIARVVGKVGPSMLLTSMSESMAFFLGALTTMPAVRVFSLYAAMAVLVDFLLQITIFIALLTLDAKRQHGSRMDVVCCAKLPVKKRKPRSGILHTLVSKYYAHFLMKEWIRPIVMIIFVGMFCAGGALTSKLNIGLDQSLSMPKDSYVLDYFHNLTKYLSVGAPVYFVVEEGHDYSTYDGQNDICGISGCPQDSLVQQIDQAALLPNYTYIAQPVSSWLDDYFSWLASPACCRLDSTTGNFCPSTENNTNCVACPLKDVEKGRPVGDTFDRYLDWFLHDNPGIKCGKGGHAAYGSGVEHVQDKQNLSHVGATYFMTYHSILKTSEDYINALKEARAISDNITKTLNETTGKHYKVFPYSVFYVFYEQYLTIVYDSILNITYCLSAILLITFVLLGFDLYSAIMVVVTIVMILTDIMGVMYLWDIDLNALSLVNLIMAIGISVEFCSHIIRAFTVSVLPTRKERAKESLGHMGSSVLSGITLTKLGGIIMLGFSKSQLFQVFYFRMYLLMVVFGASHGLIFLPVFLSYIGPPVNKAKVYRSNREKGEMEEHLNNGDHNQRNGGQSPYVYENPPSYSAVNRMSGGGDIVS